MFQQKTLTGVSFETACRGITFEQVCKGRQGAVLASDGSLVRTTTCYKQPPQPMLPFHQRLAQQIQQAWQLPCGFNNALVELYDDSYKKMSFHTDQAQDLATASYIAIFSSYSNGVASRKLVVKHKLTGQETTLLMQHNSVILFSLDTNRQHLHKILLQQPSGAQWLGITLRLAKTFIEFNQGVPYFAGTHQQLKLATEEERRQLYRYKSLENKEINFEYPELYYTLSEGDLSRGLR